MSNDLATYFNKVQDRAFREYGITSAHEVTPSISSGILSQDLVLGRGLYPGMIVLAGMEGSAKSTDSITILASAMKQNIPVCFVADPENALEPRWAGQIFKTVMGKSDVSQFQGVPKKGGGWLVQPKYRYTDSNIAEEVFGIIDRILKTLPEKRYRSDTKQWYLVFSRRKRELQVMKDLGLTHDKKLYTETGRYWCPTDNNAPQAVFIIDSLPQLVAEKMEEEEQKGSGLAHLARLLSEHLPKVRGKLRRKAAILIAVNQIRAVPMPKPGQLPEQETGGNAPKFNSAARNWLRDVVPPEQFERDSENRRLCIEPSVEGKGYDRYAFKSISNVKNKYGVPYRKGSMRVWISDRKGVGRGIDPVYDTFWALRAMGIIHGVKKGKRGLVFAISHPDYKEDLKLVRKREWTWADFKTLILAECGSKAAREAVEAQKIPVFKLRQWATKIITSGVGETLMVKQIEAKADSEDLEE